MNAFLNLIIRASAGTGKTYQLSNRYIGLVADGTAAEQILAATFARKAAGEILDRVLTRLADAALQPGKLAELAAAIGDSTLDRAKCLLLLRGLIRRLHRLRIGTLDSFFVQMAGSFSLELGLPPGWRIVDELTDLRVRAEAIQNILREDSASMLLTLVHLLGKGEASRSVTAQVTDVVAALYGVYCDTDDEAWHMLPLQKALTADELAAARERFEQFLDLPNKHFSNAHVKHVEAAASEDWGAFVEKGVAQAIISGKETFQRAPIGAELKAVYRPLIDHARAELINRLVHQTRATHSLLARFDAIYRKLKAGRRGLRFDDITRSLSHGFSRGRIREVSFRLDALVAHLLLDEFQDTSLQQWDVVRPFAEQVAAEIGRSFFCVGDVKQAIYGWRGGESEIFDAVGEQLPRLEQQDLTTSYRSSPIVIDTVNAVFQGIAQNESLATFPDVAAAWSVRCAEPHSTAKSDLRGHACLVVAPATNEGDSQELTTLSFAAAEVARLSRENPGRSVGVLVRRNAAVGRLIYELRSRHQVRASEEGGNPLTDSNGVQLILSLLRLADHPGDTAARFHVANSPLGVLVEIEADDAERTQNRQAPIVGLNIRTQLLADGYGKTVYDWVRGLAPSCDERELSRLMQLVELAYAYEPEATLRPRDFVEYVESKRVEDPSSANVRVMTVHQAKGLEFDIVVLPELDGDLKGRPPLAVVGRERPMTPALLVSRYAGAAVQALLPRELQPLFESWPNRLVNESLCLLYVALTRAVHALHMIIAPSKPNAKTWPKTYAGVLRSALAPATSAEPGAVLYERGDRDWSKHEPLRRPFAGADDAPAKGAVSEGEPVIETVSVLLKTGHPRRRGLLRQSPSGLQGTGAGHRPLAHLLRLEPSTGMDRGSLIHAWLEQVDWLDDGEPDDDVLRRVFRRFAASGLGWDKELAEFRRLLERPGVRQALRRQTYQAPAGLGLAPELCRELQQHPIAVEACRERTFAIRQDDVLLNGSIDRLVLLRHGDRIVAADIVDYKTDSVPTPADIDAKVETYRPQIEAYRRAVAQFTGLDTARITARLLFTGPGTIRQVPLV